MSEPGTGAERGNELPVGTVFAGHRIEAVIGRGGMGTVYRARDLTLDSDRALKVLDPALARDRGFRDRFQRESRLAAQIEDDAVLPIYRAGEEDGLLFIAMRLVRGPDLHRLVTTDGPLEPRRTARLVSAVAGALDAAHSRGIVHRDVKPANILVELSGGGERAYLTDFGIGRPPTSTEPLTETGELIGTADYVAPEQINGRPAEPRSDVYALGCVICFLLTGEPPFRRETSMATLYAHLNAERPRPSLLEPDLPAAVDEVVVRATALSPADRYGSAGALAAAFREALAPGARRAASELAAAPAAAETTRLPTRSRRSVVLPLVLGATLAALAALAVLLLTGGSEDAEIATIPVGGNAINSAAVGEVNVLFGAEDDSTLWAIDPEAGQPKRSDDVPEPSAVAVGFGSVWVASGSAGAVFRYGPPNRNEAVRIPVGEHPADVAVDESSVWVANRDGASVSRIQPRELRERAQIELDSSPEAIAVAAGAIWVASPDAGTITRIPAQAGAAAEQPVALGGSPVDLVAEGDSLWVLDSEAATLQEVSADSGEPLGEPVSLGGSPAALAAGLGSLWVADSQADTVAEIDPESGEQTHAYPVGKRPVALAVGDESVWVANAGGGTASRITP